MSAFDRLEVPDHRILVHVDYQTGVRDEEITVRSSPEVPIPIGPMTKEYPETVTY